MMSTMRYNRYAEALYFHGRRCGRKGQGLKKGKVDDAECRKLFEAELRLLGDWQISLNEREEFRTESWMRGWWDGVYEAKEAAQEAGHLAWDA